MHNLDNITIKEARKSLGLTQAQLAKELGMPVRTLQNWENNTRNCPKYIENLIKGKVKDMMFVAKIKFEESFNRFGYKEQEGYSCYLRNENDEYVFSWFFPVNNGYMPQDIIYEIKKLHESGWKIIFS